MLRILKKRPRNPVVGFAAGAGEGGLEGAGDGAGAAGQGVVLQFHGDDGAVRHFGLTGAAGCVRTGWCARWGGGCGSSGGAGGGVLPQVVPAEVACAHLAIGGGDADFGGLVTAFARQADA